MMNQSDNLVEIRGLSFHRSNRLLFSDINMQFSRGKVTAIMGPSGIGKTTLLRLIGGQLLPDSGEIWIDNDNIPTLSRRRLYEVRKKISILFQSSALFTDINVFENVAFPLRRHTRLPEPILRSTVLMKLEAVGLREAAALMPAELSGGMSRRASLARAIALDPALIMLDEPFVGQDPITMGGLVKLIDKLNHALGVTCIIVSHDVQEVLSIADYVYIIAEQHVVSEGTPNSLRDNQDLWVRQFLNGITNGLMSFNILDTENYHIQLLRRGRELVPLWY